MAEQEFNEESNHFDDSKNEPEAGERKKRPDLPIILDLEHPFQLGEKTYEQIEFRNKLKYKDIQHLRGDGEVQLGHFKPMIRGMTGLPSVVIDELDPVDFMRATEVVGPFLPSGPRADGTMSD